MVYSIDELRAVFLPKNIRKTRDNIFDAQNHIAIPANSIRLYDFVKDTVEYLGIIPSVTDLTPTVTSTTVTINSSTGTDAIIPAATTTLSGVMTAADKVNLTSLITLSGVAAASTHLGTFTGSIIPDSSTIKAALQALETAFVGGNGIYGGSGTVPTATTATQAGTFAINTTATSGYTLKLGGITGAPANRYGVDIAHDQVRLGNVFGTQSLGIIQLDGTSTSIQGSAGNNFSLYSTGAGQLAFTDDFIIIDSGAVGGVKYNADYSANYTNRSLVDKEYVDNTVGAHNTLSGLQGGTTNEYYHLPFSAYTKVVNLSATRLLGRDAVGTGEMAEIALAGSLTFTGSSSIQLSGDSAAPGNSYYYGTNGAGTKGFYTLPSTVSSVAVTDSADVDFTITNPTTTPDITAVLTTTGVTASTYGLATHVPRFAVDTKGRISSVVETAIAITASQVSNFSEAVDDRVNGLLVAGTDITLTYNDAANTLTIDATSASTEDIQDAIGSILVDTADIDFTYSDPTPSISAVLTTTGVSAATYGSASATPIIAVDTKGRITSASSTAISIPATQVTDFSEAVDDRVYNLLVAGSNITLNYNDVANTLTIAATGSTGYATVQDEGVAETQRAILNFVGDAFIVTDDGANSRTNVQAATNLELYAILTGVGMVSKDAIGVSYVVEITGGTGIQVANGTGVLGNPTISLNHLGIQSLADPNADRILFWDDSAGATAWLTIGSNLSITGTTINASSSALPAGTTGDFLYYDGADWVAITPVRNDQVNNTGTIITLPSTPAANTPVMVYVNGMLKTDVEDYTLSGTTLTFTFSLNLTDKVATIYYT